MRLLLSILIYIFCFGTSLSQSLDSLDYSTYPVGAQHEIASILDPISEADNPMIVTYLGSSLHDYFYFPFEDDEGRYLDFANRNNNLGDIPFGDDDEMASHYEGESLVGKKFLITWDYEMSNIYCCEGLNDPYPAMLPRIVKIEYYSE